MFRYRPEVNTHLDELVTTCFELRLIINISNILIGIAMYMREHCDEGEDPHGMSDEFYETHKEELLKALKLIAKTSREIMMSDPVPKSLL